MAPWPAPFGAGFFIDDTKSPPPLDCRTAGCQITWRCWRVNLAYVLASWRYSVNRVISKKIEPERGAPAGSGIDADCGADALLLQDRIVSIADQLGAHAFGIFDVSEWADLHVKQFVAV